MGKPKNYTQQCKGKMYIYYNGNFASFIGLLSFLLSSKGRILQLCLSTQHGIIQKEDPVNQILSELTHLETFLLFVSSWSRLNKNMVFFNKKVEI